MGSAGSLDRLEPLDLAYLYAETSTVPLHLGAVATFDAGPLVNESGQLRLGDLQAHVAGRLEGLPRFRARPRLLPPPLSGGWWEPDPRFEIGRHVRHLGLVPGDEAMFDDLAATVGARRLDRRHPLWELWFVTGLAGGRVGLIEKVHHALGDGLTGVDLTAALTDGSARGDAGEDLARRRPARPAGSLAAYLRAGTGERLRLAGAAAVCAASPARAAATLAGAPPRAAALFAGMCGLARLAPATSLNRPVGHHRRLAAVRIPLADVKATAHHHEVTVNDVVLAATTAGLRQLLLSRGERPPACLRALVPVSTRRAEEHLGAANRTAAIIADLPVRVADPVAALARIAATMAARKRQGQADGTAALLAAAGLLPGVLLGPLDRVVIQRQRAVNLVITNVVGPAAPRYLLGARMIDAVPVVPLGGNLTVGVAVLSYAGELTVGLHADPVACPDLDVVVGALAGGFAQLAPPPKTTTRRR
jgi:WS/DGAT/MGAT family acyltransferase